MKNSLFVRHVIPFIQWYGLMIVISICLDYLLHRMQIASLSYYLGYFGTALVLISFLYSLRKRKVISSGSPKTLLKMHEYLAWIGTILIIVHGGIHFNALLPWLAILMLLITLGSGLVGKFLLKDTNEAFKMKKAELVKSGLSNEEADKKLFFDSITVDAMKKWRVVHLPITYLLGILSLIHIVTIIMFAK
ncbi:MAG: hypothetical protein JST55_15865 [Bacteroidetes bacterium]|nr:hypothetical protein [Bacteroidota bacterium]